MSPAKSILMLLLVAAAAPFLLVAFTHGAFHGGEDSQNEVRLLFAGDILLSRGVERELIHNPQSLSRALQSTLSGADWAIGNLEGAVGSPDDCAESAGQSPCFAIRDDFIPLLREAGFKAIGMANNHSSDLGQRGIGATRRLLAQNDMQALTYEESPHFIRAGDLTIGFISLSMIPGRDQRAVERPRNRSAAEASCGKKPVKPGGRLYSLGKRISGLAREKTTPGRRLAHK